MGATNALQHASDNTQSDRSPIICRHKMFLIWTDSSQKIVPAQIHNNQQES